MKFLFFLLFTFIDLSCCSTLQPALVLPGNTPGVKPPGDMSYRSALCNKTVLNLTVPAWNDGRKSRASLKRRKFRPDAWEYPHVNNKDREKLSAMFAFFGDYENYCAFASKTCISSSTEYVLFNQKSKVNMRKSFSLSEWQLLPEIDNRSWGTCALVGLADTLLNSERGSEIDAHDTVIRLGELPLARFKRFVGTKTDITWIRRRAKMAQPGKIDRERVNVKMYIGGNNGIKNMSVLHPFGFINRSKMRGSISHSPHKAIYDMFKVKIWNKNGKGKKKARVASSGFKDALALIFSKYCSRVDIYGLSNNGGGAYYLPRHLMQTQHNCELESWILHFIMEQFPTLNTCVYL